VRGHGHRAALLYSLALLLIAVSVGRPTSARLPLGRASADTLAPSIGDDERTPVLAADEVIEMGPVDYVLVEWSDRQPNGELAPHLVDLVDRGLIRILDLVFIAKSEDGSVAALEISDLGAEDESLAIFEGASSGLLGEDDLDQAGGVLEPGASAALLVYENVWAAPFATAVRRSGAELVASGRIPADDLIAALEAAEQGD
jgi:Family of unknown function (DUF6325)